MHEPIIRLGLEIFLINHCSSNQKEVYIYLVPSSNMISIPLTMTHATIKEFGQKYRECQTKDYWEMEVL